MDNLKDIAQVLTDWAVAVGQNINNSGLEPTTAFVLGIVTMFIIDKILSRIFASLKWVILIGIIAGLGFSLPDIIGIFADNSPSVPEVSGF